ncbi:hypothetical protein ACFWGI_06240 [Streptomyces niveus]|uniref:hypothetical protein n=1 Tax=Streptomyces niveus TaxID=193462 RepID=UPI0036497609
MKNAHLIAAASRALRAHEDTVDTLTITTTHHPAHHTLTYDSESVAARHDDGTLVYVDLTNTEFAQELDAYAENRLANSGSLRPLTLRLGAGPTTRTPAELNSRDRLFILSIHARAAAHRPGLTGSQVLALTNLAYESNEVARHDGTPTDLQTDLYARLANAHELPFAPEATVAFLTQTARLAVRTMSHYTQPCPRAIEVPAGHDGDTPAWLAHQAVARFRDNATSREPRYSTPALRAVLKVLATLQTPAAEDLLSLYLTDTPANPAGRALDWDPTPEGAHVNEAIPGVIVTGDQLTQLRNTLGQYCVDCGEMTPVGQPDTKPALGPEPRYTCRSCAGGVTPEFAS